MGVRGDSRDAEEALVAAVRSLGLEARSGTGLGVGRDADVVITVPGGQDLAVSIRSSSLVTADSASRQIRLRPNSDDIDTLAVVVADRITADGRDRLNRAGWGWLDLRGHLKLVGPGLFVDSDVPALSRPGPVHQGLKGQVSIELAALLLLDPTTPMQVRAAAKVLARAPSTVSAAFAALRAANLVDSNRLPAVPELFWELAERWKSASADVASVPRPMPDRENSVLRLGLDDVESTIGWGLTDSVAAVAYGAPVSMRADHPPDFYLPDQSTLRRAVQLLGPAAAPQARAARVRVAPVPLVCARRVDATGWANEEWPLVNPLFVALDLAQDPGRGREILEAWEPRMPWRRVW